MRTSWQEWVIRIALVAFSLGGAWALWGADIMKAIRPAPAPAPTAEPTRSAPPPPLPSGPTQSL